MSAPEQAAHSDRNSSSVAPAHGADTAGWVVGLSLFRGILMMITGLFNAMEGVVALARNEVYAITPRYIFTFDLTTWGWIPMILGIIVLAAGVGVMTGQLWGRVVGITIAACPCSPTSRSSLLPDMVPADHRVERLRDLALCVYDRDVAAAASS